MMSDEEKLAAKFYLKNPEFRKAVNDMYKKKAANWLKGNKSKSATKVSAAGYAKRAASYLAKTGVPTAVLTGALARANVEAARRSGQGQHVRVLDVALTAFNQSRAVMNRDPTAFYHATMAGAGAGVGRRIESALVNYANNAGGGGVVSRARGAGEAVHNYMRGGAFAPNPAAAQPPQGVRPADVLHAYQRPGPLRDAINARHNAQWGNRGGRILGGAPPSESKFEFAGFDVKTPRAERKPFQFDIPKWAKPSPPTKAEVALREAKWLAKSKAEEARIAYNTRGLKFWMERNGPLSPEEMAKVNAKYDLAHGPMANPDAAADAILNHGNNKSDLANHLHHRFDFMDRHAYKPPQNPGRTQHSDGSFTRAPAAGGELPPPDTGLGGKWSYKVKNDSGIGLQMEEPPPGSFNPPPGSVRSTPRSSMGSDGMFSDTRAQDAMYDNMRLPDANDVPGATFEFGEGFQPPAASTPRRGPGVYIERNPYLRDGADFRQTISNRSAMLDEIRAPSAPKMAIDEFKHGAPAEAKLSDFSDFGSSMPERVHTYDPMPEPSAGGYSSSDIAAAQTQLAGQAANAQNAPRIREVVDRMNRSTTMSGKMVQAMIDKGGNLGKMGTFIANNGRAISGGFSIAGGALAAAGIAYGGVQLHHMHQARAELRSIKDAHPDDKQIQEFFKLNDEATKRNDVYFGLNTAVGGLAITASALGTVAAVGGSAAGVAAGFGGAAAAAGVAAGPIGWAALGIGAAVWAFTSIFESGAKKKAYREYMSQVYGSADHPSLDYYLDHKDPDLLKAVNGIKNYQLKDDATDSFKSYINGMKGDIAGAEASIKIEEGVDDPRRAQLATIMNGTVPPGELDKTSDFISRQQAQDVQQGHGPSQTWDKDAIVNHAKQQFHSDQNRYAHRSDPNLGPDLVNQTEQDHYDYEDKKNGTETHRWGYGGPAYGQKQTETPESDVL